MNIVIANSREWNDWIVEELQKKFSTEYNFHHINKPEELNSKFLSEIDPSFIFFPHWSHLISREVFENYECVIFHMTDLPFGRGGSPLQNLIVRGIKDTKVTAIKCEKELDAGPVYIKRDLSLDGTALEVFKRMSKVIFEMIQLILNDNPIPEEQRGDIVEFKRRKPEDGEISKLESIDSVYDFIRMLDAPGYPSAYIETDNLKIEFSKAQKKEDELNASVTITKK